LDILTRFRIWYAAQPRALRALLTINVIAYLLWQVIFLHIGAVNEFVFGYLALHSAWPGVALSAWQLVTYNFLHLDPGLGGLFHILFNMLWLVWIGRDYENMHGAERLLAIYLLAGIGGGLLTVAFDLITPTTFVVYGASASVLGVVATVAFLYPHKAISLLFIGNVRLIYLLAAVLVFDLLLMAGSNTAVAAHFGGAATGFAFAQAQKNGINVWSWAGIFFGGSSRQERGGTRSYASTDAGSPLSRMENWLANRNKKESARITRLDTVMRKEESETSPQSELDRILDKISEEGFDALTAGERRFLDKASQD
jgi:membrane associated rhomboid family serine protease